jgi:hypothetical protein
MTELIFTSKLSLDTSIKITDILTFATIIITLFTLWEIKKQREGLYLPDIFIPDSFANVFCFDLENKFSDFQFITNENKYHGNQDYFKSSTLLIPVFNVGFGAAKNVKVVCNFDMKQYLEIFNKLEKSDLHRIELTQDGELYEMIYRHFSSDHFDYSKCQLPSISELDLVLPKNTIKLSPKISIPEIYLKLLSYYLIFKYEILDINSTKQIYSDELEEIPNLSIQLSYKDLQGKEYSKSMVLKFSAFSGADRITNQINFNSNTKLCTIKTKINTI